MLSVKSKSTCDWKKEGRDCIFCQSEGCEAHLVTISSLKNKLRQKITGMNELFIDVFEDLIMNVKEKSLKLSGNKFSSETKQVIEHRLELSFESCKEYFATLNEKVKLKFGKNKDFVIDGFEELVEQIEEMVHFSNHPFQTLHLWKGKTIDSFETFLEYINVKTACLKKNVHCILNEKRDGIIDEFDNMFCQLKDNFSQIQWDFHSRKNLIVDEFDDLIETAKCAIEDKKSSFAKGAVNTFDDILELVDEAIEEGKEELKAELVSMNYALWFGETLLSDFLRYCDQFTTEFVKSSEKQVICLLYEGKKKAKVFYTEVIDSLVRGYEDKLLCDNLVLEINSSRYAYNVSMSEVNFHVVRAILTLPRPEGNLWQQLVSRLTYFTPILTNYIRSTAAQRDCLLAIEDVAGSHPEIFDVLVKIIHWLYEQDILSEDSIVHWYNNPSSEPDLLNAKRVRNQIAPFIKWLKEAEEQSSDDDDDD